MMFPKRVKFRKWQRGTTRRTLRETRGTTLAFGSFGLKAEDAKWIRSKQIEAARKAMARYVQRGGKIWIRFSREKPITQKPPEVTMGGGKGEPTEYVFAAKPGRILFEIDGVAPEMAKAALKRAGAKLPLKTRIVSREH